MTNKDFAVFDSDSHVVEPPALWEKYLDPEYRTLGKHALWRQEGRTGAYLKVNLPRQGQPQPAASRAMAAGHGLGRDQPSRPADKAPGH